MRLFLSKFDSDDLHCAGIKHRATDGLSSLSTTRSDNTPLGVEFQVLINETVENIDGTTTTIFALDTYSRTDLYFVTNAEGKKPHHQH